MNIVILVNTFNCYGSILSMFPENEKPKNCFLQHVNLGRKYKFEEINQKCPYGGLINYGNSYLDFFFARLNVFRLHAFVHDSAGAVKAATNKGPGYCYLFSNFSKSCFLGHLTGLIFCVSIKFYYQKIF